MLTIPGKLARRISTSLKRQAINREITQLTDQVRAAHPLAGLQARSSERPVAFFNASTRLVGMSLNAAFSLLSSLGLQLAGVPVVRFTCRAGMSLCVLGTDRDEPFKSPPCRSCIAQSQALSSDAPTSWFAYASNQELRSRINDLSLESLQEVEALLPGQGGASTPPMPLGRLVLPSIRWVLRRHHLADDGPTRHIYRQYILSAYNVASEFCAFLIAHDPQAVVVFNGQFFPEATVRWMCLLRGIRTITHEVGLLPFSAFFTTGEATAYPLQVPHGFELSEAQNRRLDDYLGQRFKGQFSMAGIQFWPEMNGLGKSFLEKADQFKQIVPIFTNVIFDTSQPHSNVVFPHMFAWLDLVLEVIRRHPETLFVLRAHPDETRPGKASRESVSQWVHQNIANSTPNLLFVDSDQSLSSYELIQRSKFIMVYNSTIGLEASILGVPVLCAGRARYTQLPTVFFPSSVEEYKQILERFLTGNIQVPTEFKHNSRRFLYYQLFRSSLPFDEYLQEDGIWPGFVRLKNFPLTHLAASHSPAINAVYQGCCKGGDFLLDADVESLTI